MALRDFLFGFKFLATDYVSPVLKNIETRIEAVNAQVKATAGWREAGTNLAIVGAGFAAAGGAVAVAIKSTVDAAAGMQTVMSHVATAVNDGAATHLHLAQAQQMSEKMAVASGIAATQEASAYYIARSNALDHAQALAAVNAATKLTIGTTASLTDAQAQLEPTTRLLTTVYQNFGDKSRAANTQIAGFADTMAKLQTQYAFKGIDEVNYAMQYAVPLAKAAGISFNDMASSLALLSESGLHGAEAGTAFSELVSKLQSGGELRAYMAENARGGIDLEKTMERLRAATAGMAPAQEALWLHQIGFTERSMRGVALLIDKTAQYKSVLNDLNSAQGANAAAFATRQAAPDVTWGRLYASLDVLRSKIGEPLLGPITSLVSKLAVGAGYLADWVGRHSQIAKFIVTFAAVGAAIAVAVGGALALVGGFLVLSSFAPAVAALVLPITAIGTAVAAAVAAVATCAPQMFSAGANLVKAIASGIWSAITLPARATEALVTKIRGYFPFSPAKEGPLRTLNRMRIVETIAESIQPGPALNAIRRTAAAVAIAAPVMFAPARSTPAFASSPGVARGGISSGIVIQVRQEVHIDGAIAGDERKLMATLRQHGEELAQIIDARLLHRSRREF
jgi:TP901 family phage tail tape measure protein